MTEDDRRRVTNFRKMLDNDDPFTHGFSSKVGRQLLAVIDRLDKQLAEIKEAGGFIELYVECLNKQKTDDHCDIVLNPGGREVFVTAGVVRRLDKALKAVEDE